MRKKIAFWAAVVIAAFIGHGCGQPVSVRVEIESDNFRVDLPIRVGSFDIASLLNDTLMDALNQNLGEMESLNGRVTLYDMVDFRGGQAFLIAAEIDMSESFNPDDYLDQIREQMAQINNINPDNIPRLEESINIPEIAWDNVPDEVFYIDMAELFRSMEDILNDTSAPETALPLQLPLTPGLPTLTIPPELFNLPDFMAFPEGETAPEMANFSSARIAWGTIKLRLRLVPDSGNLNDLTDLALSLEGIELRGKDSGYFIGSPQSEQTITLNSLNNFSGVITIDLAEADINKLDPPQFRIRGLSGNYFGVPTFPPALVSSQLIIQPEISGVALRGATNLRIGEIRQELPNSIIDAISMDTSVSEFLNAEIGKGGLTVRAIFPERNPNVMHQTFCEGVNVAVNLFVRQEPSLLNGRQFEGLGHDWNPLALNISGGSGMLDFSGRSINGNALNVFTDSNPTPRGESSHIMITSDPVTGINFMLYGNDFYTKQLPIIIGMDMEMERLDVIRLKLETNGGDLIPVQIPEIDFGNIDGNGTNIANFVESISIERIALDLDFTVPDDHPLFPPGPGLPEALDGRIAIAVRSPDIGFDVTNVITSGSNFFASTPTKLYLSDKNGNPRKLGIEVDILPVINGVPDRNAGFLEFGPFTLNTSGGETSINLFAKIDFDFAWTEAVINLEAALDEAGVDTGILKGQFPEEPDNYLDLSDMQRFVRGFTIDGVEMRIFLSGPQRLFETIPMPEVEFSAMWKEWTGPGVPDLDDASNWEDINQPKVLFTAKPVVEGSLPQLPAQTADGRFIFTDNDWLELEQQQGIVIGGTFVDVMAGLPKGLRFNYNIGLPTRMTVTPDMFDDIDGSSGIKAMVVLKLPLVLQAEPGAQITIPQDIFGNGESDLFGRKNLSSASILDDINIRSLSLRIDFDSSLFGGAYLHIDRDGKLFPNGLPLNPGGNVLEVAITGEDWNIIRNNLIFPDIRIEYPEGTTIRIARNPLLTRITFSASGSYVVELDL